MCRGMAKLSSATAALNATYISESSNENDDNGGRLVGTQNVTGSLRS